MVWFGLEMIRRIMLLIVRMAKALEAAARGEVVEAKKRRYPNTRVNSIQKLSMRSSTIVGQHTGIIYPTR